MEGVSPEAPPGGPSRYYRLPGHLEALCAHNGILQVEGQTCLGISLFGNYGVVCLGRKGNRDLGLLLQSEPLELFVKKDYAEFKDKNPIF